MKKNTMKKNTFVNGTLIAFLSIIFIKVLGAVYVIPFYKIIGEYGGTLYSYAYNIYNLFLNISTAGIPIAISMIVSEYNALEMYDAKERAYKVGKKSIFILAIVCFLFVFGCAGLIAKFLLSGVESSNINNVATVIRSISLCLLVIPFLSVLRGYMQGHKFISPTSFSQIIEQVIRVLIVIFGSYISIKLCNSSITTGVSISLTGAFFGGLGAYLFLKYKVNKNKSLFPITDKKDDVSNKEILKKIITYCIPLVIISVINDLYTIVDIKLIIKGLYMIGYDTNTGEIISSIVATWSPKICMLIMAVSIALTTNIIPNMVSSFTKNDMKGVNYRFNQALNTMLIISIPMAILLFMLSDLAYYLFYGYSEYGFIILGYSAICHVFVGIWTIINTSLQSIKKFKLIYINSLVGLTINALIDIPLIILFNKIGFYPFVGTIFATSIGCIVSSLIVLIYLKKKMHFEYNSVFKLLRKLIIPVIIMILPIILIRNYITIEYTYMNVIVYGIIFGVYGVLSYLIITYSNGALEDTFGSEFIDNILKKIKLKK